MYTPNPRRRQLRKDSTHAEQILWNEIRNKKLGHRFVRQYSLDGYVLDLYCPKSRLGIELEGGIHDRKDVKIYDRYRERYVKAFKINIIKFKNNEVENQLAKVLKTIKFHLNSPSL